VLQVVYIASGPLAMIPRHKQVKQQEAEAIDMDERKSTPI